MKSGYWQVELNPEDKEKTAFAINNELWQFRILPFGLCNAPGTFIRIMNEVLQGLVGKICRVILDDIIIFGRDFVEHLSNLQLVFSRLTTANLKVNTKKCIFFKYQVLYLVHIISKDGIKCCPKKTSSIYEWPVPQTKRQDRSFLGLCSYYRKYVKGFANIAKPLHILTEDKIPFKWTSESQSSFDQLKSILAPSGQLFPKFKMVLKKSLVISASALTNRKKIIVLLDGNV